MQPFVALLRHEFLLEWRQRNALGGILLYVVSTVFVAYITFKVVPPLAWIAIYWVIMLFAGTNAVAKSFMQLSAGRMLYYYSTVHPLQLVAAKLLYNTLLLWTIHLLTALVLSVLVGNPVQDMPWFLFTGAVGILGFSGILTLVSAIAQKASNQSTLMAILSFPVLIPVLVLVIKLSKQALDGLDRSLGYESLGSLLAINALVVAVALLLFPYLWKD
ncbi:MAG: heme exporter protein CcmB [Sphingobacteriaceae bacterium]|nr:heme exporter protein CcmB [Sphingobacteriaceae bacterium]